jgi:YggT family protein
MIAILIHVVLSWFAPGSYNPAVGLITAMVYPILRPFSSLIPRIGGIDISPVIVIILMQASMIGIAGLRPIPI